MTERIQTYEQAIDFLHGRLDFERVSASLSASDFKLERMRGLLEKLNNPHQGLPAVHIAGTKGKGSTAFLVAGILQAAGYRTGLFTSPHIEIYEERIRINGELIARAELVSLVDQLSRVAAEIDARSGNRNPTFFELTTALAWLHFRNQQAEIVVLETGLGGRLDTTNVCEPVVSVITTISRDHIHILGATLAEIAAEKAGIIKPGIPAVSGVRDREAAEVIERVAYDRGSRLRVVSDGATADGIGASTVPQTSSNGAFAMRGPHQRHNAAVAIAALKELQQAGWNVSDEAVRQGLRDWNVPARIEVVGETPLQILDSAHNWASVEALMSTLSGFDCDRRILVFATSRDKDARGLLRRLIPDFDTVILTEFPTPARTLPLRDLVRIAGEVSTRRLHAVPDPISAWKTARRLCPPSGVCCVAGSFFLAAEVRQQIENLREPESTVSTTV